MGGDAPAHRGAPAVTLTCFLSFIRKPVASLPMRSNGTKLNSPGSEKLSSLKFRRNPRKPAHVATMARLAFPPYRAPVRSIALSVFGCLPGNTPAGCGNGGCAFPTTPGLLAQSGSMVDCAFTVSVPRHNRDLPSSGRTNLNIKIGHPVSEFLDTVPRPELTFLAVVSEDRDLVSLPRHRPDAALTGRGALAARCRSR